MSKELDIFAMERRSNRAKDIADKLYTQAYKNDIVTYVLQFAKSYYVFTAGNNTFRAYPLSTTKYRWFEDAEEVYTFLKDKDIKEVYCFEGELGHSTIREVVKKDCSRFRVMVQ
jgi:hypothetical protein